MKKHLIKEIEAGSIAEELKMEPGDKLLAINDKNPVDILEYNLDQTGEYVELLIEKKSGLQEIYEIEKDFYEEIGLIFEEPALDKMKQCHNKCLFCFIDQLPQGMRKTLGVKDDDYRMSFMFGNYITLTNLKNEDIQRIIELNLSPMYVSIHATDPETRVKLMGQKKAGKIMDLLHKFKDNNIDFHGQLVLCPGINDKDILVKSLEDCKQLLPNLLSLSVVPVGLTEHRTSCFPLEKFDKDQCREIIGLVDRYQKEYKEICEYNTVYASDEFFVTGEVEIPSPQYYEDYPQLENGVGIVSCFLEDTKELSRLKLSPSENLKLTLVTAQSAEQYLHYLDKHLNSIDKVKSQIAVVKNQFFGESITVAGLLTGQDILKALEGRDLGDYVILPKACTKDDQLIFLDGMSVEELESKLQTKVVVVSTPLEIAEILGGI